jgi:two-component system sensor histidine kinase HydH
MACRSCIAGNAGSKLSKEHMTIPAATFEEEIPSDDLTKQKSVFYIITLIVGGLLLLIHAFFASILGEPSLPVIVLLGLMLALSALELLWLNSRSRRLTERGARIESYVSITSMFAITALLTYFTNRDENPYFVLLAIPILQCAYMFGLRQTILTVVAADTMILFWIWHFYALHPPARVTEYLEIGMLCVVYMLMGLVVWFLVNRLKANQSKLKSNLELLQATRARLISEEKLAAIGRLASGVAHEIRNPVGMISSSLATATHPGTEEGEREEMFAIAARESKRLESLTADFLTYARPSPLRRSPVLMNDQLSYIAAVTRAHAASRGITIVSELEVALPAEIDAPQMEGALLNLVLNAIDATPSGGMVKLNASQAGDGLRIDVEDSGPAIPEQDLPQIFEPFFTTKPAGTGLGLAIARSAAIAHGGDLHLSQNRDGCVIFSMVLTSSAFNQD